MIIRWSFFILLLSAVQLQAAELHVLSPKSLKSVMIEISEIHEKNNPGTKVELRTDRSNVLTALIIQGSSADVFLLDDENSVRQLRAKKMAEGVKPFLADDLVVVANATSKLTIADPTKLSFPELKGVGLFSEKNPLGKAAREYLKKIGLWDSILSKIGIQKDTKSAIKSLQDGLTDWAVLYNSDVVHASGLKVLWKIPEKDVTPNKYYLGKVSASHQKKEANQFIEIMQSTIATKFFENAGLRMIRTVTPSQ